MRERQREEENVDEYKQTTMCCWHGNNPGWMNEQGNVAKWPQEPAELLLHSSCSHSCSHCTHVCGHRVMCVFCLLLPGHRTCQTVACSKPPSNLPHCLPVWPAPLLLPSVPPACNTLTIFICVQPCNQQCVDQNIEGRSSRDLKQAGEA